MKTHADSSLIGLFSGDFAGPAFNRFLSRLSTCLMLSATGKFSGIVPPNS